MINDGGAERMVRKKKTEWWQLLAVGLMGIMVCLAGIVLYFAVNPQQFVHLMDKTVLKDGYDIMREIKEQYSEIAVYGYHQTRDKVTVEFRYYEEVLEQEIDLIALSYSVKTSFEQYLEEYPDYFICTGNYQVELRFPDVIYRNYTDDVTEYGKQLLFVTYEYSGIEAGEFASQLSKIKEAKELYFVRTEGHPLTFDADTDFEGLREIEGLESVSIDPSNLTQEQKEALRKLAEEQEIEILFRE